MSENISLLAPTLPTPKVSNARVGGATPPPSPRSVAVYQLDNTCIRAAMMTGKLPSPQRPPGKLSFFYSTAAVDLGDINIREKSV